MTMDDIKEGRAYRFKSGVRHVIAIKGWASGRYVEWEPVPADGAYRECPLRDFVRRALEEVAT